MTQTNRSAAPSTWLGRGAGEGGGPTVNHTAVLLPEKAEFTDLADNGQAA